MPSQLLCRIVKKVFFGSARLRIVNNPDGLLVRADVRAVLKAEMGIEVVTGTQLEQRIHYELEHKVHPDRPCIYVTNKPDAMLADIRRDAVISKLTVGELFPFFPDKELLARLDWETLRRLYSLCGMRKVSYYEGQVIVDRIKADIERERRESAEYHLAKLKAVTPHWHNPVATMDAISKEMVDAIKDGTYNELQPEIDRLNTDFQGWIDTSYFINLHSNPLVRPKSVNNILPHIAEKHSADDKVALVVVDGVAYWQYFILRNYLEGKGIKIDSGTTTSWLPSITMLSRQAIFRGNDPLRDYKQSPANERKLWNDYWQQEGIGSYAIQYLYDTDEFAINENVRRLAYVTVEMDEKMHSSTDFKDLLSLTENWCSRITEKIQAMLNAGFTIYFTTDHGSVLATGWRNLTQVEKVFLYADGSRGKRHQMYKNVAELNDFCNKNKDIDLLKHDNWLAVRGNECFARNGQQMITHGGSHFMEVVIPFACIKP